MGELQTIIDEIHRHKGVLLDDDKELQRFAEELFYGASELLGVRRDKVRSAAPAFVLNKYRQVLDYTKQCYEAQPDTREFYFRPKWSDLEDLQLQLARQYREK